MFIFGCAKKEVDCDITYTLFPKPAGETIVIDIDGIFENPDSIKNVLCKTEAKSLSLKVDDVFINYDSIDIFNICNQSSVITCGYSSGVRVSVLFNAHKQILMEGQLVKLEAIDSMFYEIYINPSNSSNYIVNPRKSIIDLKCDKRADKNMLKSIIKGLAFGYSTSVSSLYPNTSEVALCDSVQLNLNKIRKDYRFQLQLNLGENFVMGGRVPPPPPYDELPNAEEE